MAGDPQPQVDQSSQDKDQQVLDHRDADDLIQLLPTAAAINGYRLNDIYTGHQPVHQLASECFQELDAPHQRDQRTVAQDDKPMQQGIDELFGAP